jgi:hypothetical protein
MRRVFENLNELENFLKEEKDFLYKLIFYRIEEAFDTNEEIEILDCYSKDVFINIQISVNKKNILPCLQKLEKYFATTEEYEKCQKILEYKKLVKLGF